MKRNQYWANNKQFWLFFGKAFEKITSPAAQWDPS